MNANVLWNGEEMEREKMPVQGHEFDVQSHMKARSGGLFVNLALWNLDVTS